MAAGGPPGAGGAGGELCETAPTTGSATWRAASERGGGADDQVVKAWLARAVTVPRGPQWICDNCQHIHTGWQPVCENCNSFDTLTWRRPPAAELQMPAGAEMLPLIVGPAVADTQVVAVSEGGETEDAPHEGEVIDAPQPSTSEGAAKA